MKVALIGLGMIAEKYISSFEQEKDFELLYICDIQKTPLAEMLSNRYEFLYNYQEIPLDFLDCVFIATPLATHFEIASYFLIRKINVVLEKPATPDFASFEKLINIAKTNNVFFDVVFHWRFGNEALYLQKNKALLSDFSKLSIIVKDSYYDDRIIRSKLHLGGAWLDGGINALGFLSDFIDLSNLQYVDGKSITDPLSGQVYYARRTFGYKNSLVEIIVDWNPVINKKHSLARKGNDLLYIDHSNQSILFNDEVIYKSDDTDRLLTHYHNYIVSLKTCIPDFDTIYLAHKILFADE